MKTFGEVRRLSRSCVGWASRTRDARRLLVMCSILGTHPDVPHRRDRMNDIMVLTKAVKHDMMIV